MDETEQKDFIAAVSNGDLSIVRRSLEQNAALVDAKDTSNAEKNSALILAIKKGHIGIAQMLIENGAKLNEKDYYNNTALTLAVKMGQTTPAQALIDNGAELDEKNKDNNTALLIAVKNSQIKIAEALIDAGAELDEKDGENKTALFWSIDKSNKDLALYLIKNGAGLDEKSLGGWTALMWAVYKNDHDIINSLIENGAELDERNTDRKTALELAHGWGRSTATDIISKAVKERAEKKPAKHVRERPVRREKAPALTTGDIQKRLREKPMPFLKGSKPAEAPVKEGDAKEKETPNGHETWALMGKDRVAFIGIYPEVQKSLTHIFNFAARERLTVVQNLQTGMESAPPEKSFDELPAREIKKAFDEFKNLGGEADEEFILHGNQIFKRSAPHPDKKL